MSFLRFCVVESSELSVGDGEDTAVGGQLQAARDGGNVDAVNFFTGVYVPHSV